MEGSTFSFNFLNEPFFKAVYGETGYEKLLKPKKMTFHPGYDQYIGQPPDADMNFDIVIIELDQMVPLDIYTPACLAKPGQGARFDGKLVTLAGYGKLSFHAKTRPNEPYEVNVTVARTDTCPISIVDPNKICLGQDKRHDNSFKGACKVTI